MPWAKVSLMDSRMCFVSALVRGDGSMSEACARHGISRGTGCKWLSRCHEGGVAGLTEQSRLPPRRVMSVSGQCGRMRWINRRKWPRISWPPGVLPGRRRVRTQCGHGGVCPGVEGGISTQSLRDFRRLRHVRQ